MMCSNVTAFSFRGTPLVPNFSTSSVAVSSHCMKIKKDKSSYFSSLFSIYFLKRNNPLLQISRPFHKNLQRCQGLEAGEVVLEWDVVEFPWSEERSASEGKEDTFGVGHVVKVEGNSCSVHPLFFEESSGLWLETYSGDLYSVSIDQVRVLDQDVSQRMDPDRVSNPHGEHAQNVWEIFSELKASIKNDLS
mmetsp:Transcript_28710/g.39674  ORF Transcript_28710/g.39674 Transcript_28710/m.39674 type:complete len:191 (+) Transcript_28710:129-701(+)